MPRTLRRWLPFIVAVGILLFFSVSMNYWDQDGLDIDDIYFPIAYSPNESEYRFDQAHDGCGIFYVLDADDPFWLDGSRAMPPEGTLSVSGDIKLVRVVGEVPTQGRFHVSFTDINKKCLKVADLGRLYPGEYKFSFKLNNDNLPPGEYVLLCAFPAVSGLFSFVALILLTAGLSVMIILWGKCKRVGRSS